MVTKRFSCQCGTVPHLITVVVLRYRCGPASQTSLEMEKFFAAFGGALNKFGQEIKCDLNLFDWCEVGGRPSKAFPLSPERAGKDL